MTSENIEPKTHIKRFDTRDANAELKLEEFLNSPKVQNIITIIPVQRHYITKIEGQVSWQRSANGLTRVENEVVIPYTEIQVYYRG